MLSLPLSFLREEEERRDLFGEIGRDGRELPDGPMLFLASTNRMFPKQHTKFPSERNSLWFFFSESKSSLFF